MTGYATYPEYRCAIWNARRANRVGMRLRALFWLNRCADIRLGMSNCANVPGEIIRHIKGGS